MHALQHLAGVRLPPLDLTNHPQRLPGAALSQSGARPYDMVSTLPMGTSPALT